MGLNGACAYFRESDILEKVESLRTHCQQILFVWDLRSVQNQACGTGHEKKKKALDYPVFHFSVLALPLTQTFTNITAIYEVPTKGYSLKNA